MDWNALAGFVAAIITSIGGNARGANRFLESWSPATRYRELRLLRSRESKVKDMNSASSYRMKEDLRSIVRDSDCKIARFKFARELKDPRKNFMLAEESASLPMALIIEFISALAFVVLFMDGVLVLSGVFNLRGWPPISFVFAVFALFCLSAVIWILLTWVIKQFCWNDTIKYCFNNFLKPVFQEPRVFYYKQVEFQKAVRSFHNIYDDSTIFSLKRVFRRLLVIGSFLYFLASLIDTGLGVCFPGNRVLRFHPVPVVAVIALGAVLLCCMVAYSSKLEELIQKEKEKHLWYNPLYDANHVRHYAILDKACEFGYRLGDTFGKPRKREEQHEQMLFKAVRPC